MARISKAASPAIDASMLRNPVVFVVDMVNGFVKEGALADPAIAQIASPIRELIEKTSARVWFINDNHTKDAAEFASFPVHCLKGSEEAKVIDELADVKGNTLYKNCISAAASPQFGEMLDSLGQEPCDLIVTGCCTDLCILQLALPLQSWINQKNRKDTRVIVLEDCVETYHIGGVHDAEFWNEAALANMAANGITIASFVK